MTLGTRLLLLMVAVPCLGMIAAVAIAGSIFNRSLKRDIDHHLIAQASVESSSLFDGPGGTPHLHLLPSRLQTELGAFAANTAVYDDQGELVMATSRADAQPHIAVPKMPRGEDPTLQTLDDDVRMLQMSILAPDGRVYSLQMSTPLAPIRTTMASFYRIVGGTITGIVLALLVLSLLQARAMVKRINDVMALVGAVRRLDAPPPLAPSKANHDELGALTRALSEAGIDLHRRHLAQQRFLANAAHQLRTPLAVMRTEFDLALRRPREADELRTALHVGRDETDRLAELARRLLDFESFRTHELLRVEVDLVALANAVVERQSIHAAAQKRAVTIHVTKTSPTMVTWCDDVLVAQALENLLDNAVRFAAAETVIDVELDQEGPILFLRVSNLGETVATDLLRDVFEPFVRGTSSRSQTGLGLAIVDDILRKHGGTATMHCTPIATADPTPVARTTVTLAFPFRDPPAHTK